MPNRWQQIGAAVIRGAWFTNVLVLFSRLYMGLTYTLATATVTAIGQLLSSYVQKGSE